MNNHRHHPWFGLDDLGADEIASIGYSDPKPLYNEKSQREQDKALQNPEQSIDKDDEKPWVQGNETRSTGSDNSGVNKSSIKDNNDTPADEWAEPGNRTDVPRPR